MASARAPGAALDGVLVVDKPRGLTSFDVVREIRRASQSRRTGHGGTLDPLATGVLPICLGEATKLAQFLLDADKVYRATLALGTETDTYDADGAITRRAATDEITEATVTAALAGFRGAIVQRAPVYSALKRDGRPLYDYARNGEAVEPPERAVTIHELTLVDWGGPAAVTLDVRCSKGTYVRSLAFDLGRALGCGAHLTALRRTQSGPFTIDRALPLDDVAARLRAGQAAELLVGLSEVLGHLPRWEVTPAVALALVQGKAVPWAAVADGDAGAAGGNAAPPVGRFQILAPGGALLAVSEAHPDGLVRTVRVFHAEQVSAESRKNAEKIPKNSNG